MASALTHCNHIKQWCIGKLC